MRLLKKLHFKKVILITFLVLIISGLISSLVIIREYKSYQDSVNQVICNIIGKIKFTYPEMLEVSEEEIIKLLNLDKISREDGKVLLKQYGIDAEKMSIIFRTRKSSTKNINSKYNYNNRNMQYTFNYIHFIFKI